MTQKHDLQYLNLIATTLDKGTKKTDRTNTGTISYSSQQMRFDLSDGSIPLLTTKKMFTRGMIEEILWYFRGETNIKPLLDANVHIWDEWADENGDLGPVYGAMWRAWPDIQIATGVYELDEFYKRGYRMELHGGGEYYVMKKEIDQQRLGQSMI